MKTVRSWHLVAFAVTAGALLARCSCDEENPPPPPDESVPANRCEADLTPYLTDTGNAALASKIEDASQLIGGEAAQGRLGDFLLQNDRIRVVVQAPDRHINPNPYGGQIIDGDVVRSSGPGMDAFGKIAPLYNFGRTQEATDVGILRNRSGAGGGSAVVVADGIDAVNDFININPMFKSLTGGGLTVDTEKELPLKISTYYILNPGESRVRMVTALCNTGDRKVVLPVGDLIDSGGDLEFFHPNSACGVGYSCSGITLDTMSWYGFQGKGVAYGYAPWTPGNPSRPSTRNAVLVVSGVAGTLLNTGDTVGADQTLLSYADASAASHEGELAIPAGDGRVLVRDFVVGRDIGEVSGIISTSRKDALGIGMGNVKGHVTVGGKGLAGARVVLERDVPNPAGGTLHNIEAVFVTDETGAWGGTLPAGDYTISAWAPATKPTTPKSLNIPGGDVAETDFALDAPRTVTVEVKDDAGNLMPAKVTLLCDGTCAVPFSTLTHYKDIHRDRIPDNVALMDFVGATGKATFKVPAGKYRAVVTRGPEWSAFPPSWSPTNAQDVSTGFALDLTASDGVLNATLVHVVDTAGWMSADFHVHAINSPDAYVPNQERVEAFMAEGVDVLVSTDHDYVTDFNPLIEQLGAKKFITNVVGIETTTFEYGHSNFFPLVRDNDDLLGGNIDWAGGDGPSLTTPQYFQKARERGAKTIQVNHPRGSLAVFDAVLLDTDTGATHADPKAFRNVVDGATVENTRLFDFSWNAMEIFNGAGATGAEKMHTLMNDWFTFLSRGILVAGTGVSDTHNKYADAAGYFRSFVNVGTDDTSTVSPDAVSAATNKLQLVASNGPFLNVKAHGIDGTGAKVGSDVGIGGTLASGGNNVELAIDVQLPAWAKLNRIEVYSHIPGGDQGCPLPSGKKYADFPRSRVSCNGVWNSNWPAEGIVASADLNATDVVVEKVKDVGGLAYNRAHVTKTLKLPAAPTKDTWLVVAAFGNSGTMFPLFYPGVDKASGKASDGRPMAVANPIFIDADGGGYDKFPAKAYALAKPQAPDLSAPAKPKFGYAGDKLPLDKLLDLIRFAGEADGH